MTFKIGQNISIAIIFSEKYILRGKANFSMYYKNLNFYKRWKNDSLIYIINYLSILEFLLSQFWKEKNERKWLEGKEKLFS